MIPSSRCCSAASSSASPSSKVSEKRTVAVAPVEQLLEPVAPLLEREVDERLAVDLEQVEDEVDERRPGLALLHRGEARRAPPRRARRPRRRRRSPASSGP